MTDNAERWAETEKYYCDIMVPMWVKVLRDPEREIDDSAKLKLAGLLESMVNFIQYDLHGKKDEE